MPIDINTPLGQALYQEGISRGYSPMAIAMSLGNAAQESSLRADGPDGDNGSAHGGMQWRADRFNRLNQLAQENGTTWQDPNIQAKHWWNELDGVYGSEKAYGDALKAARTPEEANNAIISALRPAGWSMQNPAGGDGYQNRLKYGLEAYAALNGGKVPQVNPADLPAPGAVEASAQTGQPGFAVPGAQPQAQAPDDNPISKFRAMLNGGKAEPWSFQKALEGVAVAAMARSNPSGAAALAKYYDDQSPKKGTGLTPHLDTKTGQIVWTDTMGNAVAGPIAGYQKPAPEANASVMKLFDSRQKAAETDYQTIAGGQKILGMLADGSLDPSLANSWSTWLHGWTGQSTPGETNIAFVKQWAEKTKQSIMNQESGVHTDSDAVRALDQIASGEAFTDRRRLAAAVNNVVGMHTQAYQTQAQTMLNGYQKYGDLDPGGELRQSINERLKGIRETNETLKEKVNAILTDPRPGARDQNTTISTRPGQGSTAGSGGSLDEVRRRLLERRKNSGS